MNDLARLNTAKKDFFKINEESYDSFSAMVLMKKNGDMGFLKLTQYHWLTMIYNSIQNLKNNTCNRNISRIKFHCAWDFDKSAPEKHIDKSKYEYRSRLSWSRRNIGSMRTLVNVNYHPNITSAVNYFKNIQVYFKKFPSSRIEHEKFLKDVSQPILLENCLSGVLDQETGKAYTSGYPLKCGQTLLIKKQLNPKILPGCISKMSQLFNESNKYSPWEVEP